MIRDYSIGAICEADDRKAIENHHGFTPIEGLFREMKETSPFLGAFPNRNTLSPSGPRSGRRP